MTTYSISAAFSALMLQFNAVPPLSRSAMYQAFMGVKLDGDHP